MNLFTHFVLGERSDFKPRETNKTGLVKRTFQSNIFCITSSLDLCPRRTFKPEVGQKITTQASPAIRIVVADRFCIFFFRLLRFYSLSLRFNQLHFPPDLLNGTPTCDLKSLSLAFGGFLLYRYVHPQ